MVFGLHYRGWPWRLSARRLFDMAAENWTFWLNMTNFALGMVTVLALVVVFSAVCWDLLVRKVHTAHSHDELDLSTLDGELRAMLQGSHTMYEPGLGRSEEHTSELQSLRHLVCRLLLEK